MKQIVLQDGIGCFGHTEYLSPLASDPSMEESAHGMIQSLLPRYENYGLESTASTNQLLFPHGGTCTSSSKNKMHRKKKCCMCSSHSLLSSTQVMSRYVQCGYVGYNLTVRHFCAKHSPPLNMMQSGRLLDDRQAMELAYYRETCKKKGRFQ